MATRKTQMMTAMILTRRNIGTSMLALETNTIGNAAAAMSTMVNAPLATVAAGKQATPEVVKVMKTLTRVGRQLVVVMAPARMDVRLSTLEAEMMTGMARVGRQAMAVMEAVRMDVNLTTAVVARLVVMEPAATLTVRKGAASTAQIPTDGKPSTLTVVVVVVVVVAMVAVAMTARDMIVLGRVSKCQEDLEMTTRTRATSALVQPPMATRVSRCLAGSGTTITKEDDVVAMTTRAAPFGNGELLDQPRRVGRGLLLSDCLSFKSAELRTW